MWRMWQADHHVGTNVGEAGQRSIWLQVLHMVNDHHKLDASNWSLFTLGGIVHAGIKLGGGGGIFKSDWGCYDRRAV